MSEKHIISSGYHVPLDYLNDSQLFQLKSELRIKSKYADSGGGGLGYDSGDEEPIQMYKKTDDDFIVPRIYGIKRFADSFDFIDRTQEGTEIDVTFSSDEGLRERTNQPHVVSEMYDHLQDYHCGIMKSVTGTGKTIMSLALIEKIGVTTMVIVHNTDLLKEWQKKIDQFLPDADVGLFWQDKQDYVGKDIVIAMKDTLYSRIEELETSFINWPGNIVVDECVRYDAKVLTVEYGYIKAGKLYEKLSNGEKIACYSQDKNGLTKKPITNFWKHAKEKSVVVKTKSGEKIPVSTDHEFEIWSTKTGEKKWIKAKNLDKGDLIVRCNDKKFNPETFDEKAYFLGLFIGNGHFLEEWKGTSYNKPIIRFSFSKDVDWWKKTIKNFTNKVKITENSRGDTNILVYDDNYIKLIENFGFTPGEKTGEIPSVNPLQKSDSWIKGYIRGVFDAEGAINEDGFLMGMVDKNIIMEIHRVLRFIGIRSRFYSKERKTENHSCVYGIKTSWYETKKLVNKIGFGMDRKIEEYQKRKADKDVTGSGFDFSVFAKELLNCKLPARVYERKIGYKGLNARKRQEKSANFNYIRKILKSGYNYINSLDFTDWDNVNKDLLSYKDVADETEYTVGYTHKNINKLEHIYSNLAKQEIKKIRKVLDKYNWLLHSELDPVESIEFVEDESVFFDFEVPDTHKFICNGMNVHNCHRLGARTYSDLMFKFPAQKRWGLSATPKRKDGLTEVISNHIGPIVVSNDEHTVNPEIYMIPTGVRLDKSMYQKGPNLIFESMRTDLLKVQKRNELILAELKKAYENDRKIIVLTDRRDHIDNLERKISEDITQSVGQLVGGMSDDERKIAKNCRVILGTFAYAKEGLDIEDADTLFLVSPRSNIEQPVGRIRREYEDKKSTLVVDFVDNMDITKKMAYKRKQFYKREDFEINDYVLSK